VEETGKCFGKRKQFVQLRGSPQINTLDDGRRQWNLNSLKLIKEYRFAENGVAEGFYFCLKIETLDCWT